MTLYVRVPIMYYIYKQGYLYTHTHRIFHTSVCVCVCVCVCVYTGQCSATLARGNAGGGAVELDFWNFTKDGPQDFSQVFLVPMYLKKKEK